MRRSARCHVALRATLAGGLVLFAVGVAGCGPAPSSATAPAASASAATGSATVSIHDFAFGPQTITVHSGTTVTWTNHDPSPTNHTATADGGAFDTGLLAHGQPGSFRFTTPGRYAYHCAVHNYMTGVVVVVP